MNRLSITQISIDQLSPHPDNPRKDLGDITELTESIKKSGVMQNLTVVPLDENYDKFRVIIGHRRLAACKAAGVTTVPCLIIEGMTDKEQMAMMLDLGSTEAEIADKTGFSTTTVHHRLEMAKLNPKLLKQKQEDEGFQITLKDLQELEKLDNIKDREQVLRNCSTSASIRNMVVRQKHEIRNKSNFQEMAKILKAKGLKEAPKDVYPYSSKYTEIKSCFLSEKPLKKFDLNGNDPTKCLYKNTGYSLVIFILNKDRVKGKPKTTYQMEQEEFDKKKKQIDKLKKAMLNGWLGLIRDIIENDLGPEGMTVEEVQHRCIGITVRGYATTNINSLCGDVCGNKPHELATEDQKRAFMELSDEKVLLLIAYSALKEMSIYTYNLDYQEKPAEIFAGFAAIMSAYGNLLSEDEMRLLNGTHELYKKA